jgi:hypothetical protein
MRLNNVLFIHCPRTGGTHFEEILGFKNLSKMLSNHDGPGYKHWGSDRETLMGWDEELNIMLQHATYKQLINNKLINENNSHIKVSIVRNPYPRTFSLFRYFGGDTKWGSFDEFLDRLESKKLAIRYFYLSQYEYLSFKSNIVIDNIIKFENYKDDAEKFKAKHKLDMDITFQSDMQTRKCEQVLSRYFNKERCKKVESIYAKDFEVFNYETLSHTLS